LIAGGAAALAALVVWAGGNALIDWAAPSAPLEMGKGKSENNQAQNKQAKDALNTAGKQIGRSPTKDEQRRFHDEIGKVDTGDFGEMVDIAKEIRSH